MTPDESQMIKDMHRALCGDPEYGEDGLIKEHKKTQEDVKSLKQWRMWGTGVSSGFSAAIAAFLVYWKIR